MFLLLFNIQLIITLTLIIKIKQLNSLHLFYLLVQQLFLVCETDWRAFSSGAIFY